MNKSRLPKLKHKIFQTKTPETPTPQYQQENKKCWVKKENHD